MGALFVVGYVYIAIEHVSHVNKSGVAILLGVTLWALVRMFAPGHEPISEAIGKETQDIFAIVVFLLTAMAIVEVLVHYQFFDWVQEKIMQKKFSTRGLFWFLGALTFVFSAFLDNLTTTLIMIQIGRKIYKDKENFLLYVANTVIAANAGGAASPIGDVTTIMLWLAEKFTAAQILMVGTIPAIVTWVIPQYLLGRKIKTHEVAQDAHPEVDLVKESDVKVYWSVVAVALISFSFPVIANLIGLPPFMGLLMGMGLLWVMIDVQHKKNNVEHNNGQLMSLIQKVDLATLKFFIGILLAVGALSHVGLLKEFSGAIFGADPSMWRIVAGNVVLGFMSAIVDNVPLVAGAIKMFGEGIAANLWVLLALTAGTGGSMLVIGSAAGVAAMGQVKELTFVYYLRKATFPAFLGFVGGVATWCAFALWG